MTNWYEFPKWSDEYEKGLDEYLDNAFSTRAQGQQISCPCQRCCYRYWFCEKNVVKDHVISNGYIPRLEKQTNLPSNVDLCTEKDDEVYGRDDIDGLLHDTFRYDEAEEAKKFYTLVEEGQAELFPGCKNFSKLSFTIRLFIFKCDNKLSIKAFNDLLGLLRAVLPEAKLPSSYSEAKNILKGLGLNYVKIEACPNDCMLYWENHLEATHCHICKSPRWKPDQRTEVKGKPRRTPFKVLRYFPVKKRLQRLYMCAKTARDMTWHSDSRPMDNMLRHPADGKSWKDFDLTFPEFAKEPRNVRLGLSTDGFNPFSTMSISHSTWPVILMNYNLPPWMCMKPEFFMLALLIPGPQSPGNDIDIYMQPLIKELKEIWEFGLETYDSSKKEMFRLYAALLFTVSDFPAYAMLSGWSTKGKTACPNCHYETSSKYLPSSKKHCYMDHERFMREGRDDTNDSREGSFAPTPLKGAEILELLADFENCFGKTEERKKKDKKRLEDGIPWRKKPIFFELPYWKNVACGHYLDVMHIEKNVCDSIIGTLLDLSRRTKDHFKARRDLEALNIMSELHLQELVEGKTTMPKSRFWLSKEKRRRFCAVLKSAKLPQSCGSNIARCVQVAEGKIAGYKSHDAHLIMQHLLPIAVRTTLPKDVALPFIRMSSFFRGVFSKVVNPNDLEQLQSDIVYTLCELERIFPPAFFDVMMHLPVHLVDEIKLGGPASPKCMYSIERYLRKLKSYVRNKSQPEGSIAERYLRKLKSYFVVDENEAYGNILNSTTQDQVVHEEPRSTNQDSTLEAGNKKHRGPTLMVKVHGRSFEERPQIFLNEKGQPIGPPSVVTELAGFLGTIAKDPQLAPINILDWKCMPTKETIWSYVKEKFKIEEEGKKYVLQTINDDWRVYKSRLKRKHYTPFESNEERWSKRPATVPENQFRELLDYWDSKVGKEIANVNATNRQKHEDVHTLGPRSIARLRHELKEKSANKDCPSDSMVYKLSRKRNPTHVYKTDGCKTKENIEKMKDIELQIEKGVKDKDVDPYSEVITKEHKGKTFLQGRGLKKSNSNEQQAKGGYIVDKEFFQNMKAEWEKETIPIFISKFMSELQAANPQMNLVLPSFTSVSENPEENRNGVNSLQDVEDDEEPEDVEDGAD